jgi:hypothetical protein
MAGARTKATDYTGREREKLQKEHAEEMKLRAEEMSMATAAKVSEVSNSITDLTESFSAPVILDSIEEVEVSVSETNVVIRVNEDIDDMTLGVGSNYTFKAGQKYKVKKEVADHLEEKGYIWH